MALSDAEKLSCFEILEAYWDTTATITNGFGVELTLTQLDTLKNDISARLTALDTASLVKVSALVVEWDACRLDTLRLEQGTTGGVNGVFMDSEKQQARIRKLLHTYVPVMHMVEAMKVREGPTGSGGISVGVCRC